MYMALELGAKFGRAVGRCLCLRGAGVKRCGVLGALVTAFGGGGLGPLLMLIISKFDNEWVALLI